MSEPSGDSDARRRRTPPDRHRGQTGLALTRASILVPATTLLGKIGAPVERLLRSAGIPEWVLSDGELLIPTASVARFLARVARTQGIENFGLLAGHAAGIETLGHFGRLVRGTPKLGDALQALARHHSTYSSNGRMWLNVQGDHVELCQAFMNRFDDEWLQSSHYILTLMLGVVRLGAGADWRPARVRLQTVESNAVRDFDPLSSAHVTFGDPASSILVPRALLDAPIGPPRDPGPGMPTVDEDAWRASAPAVDFVGSVVQVLETLSWEGYPDIRRTADVLRMSVRTLQRRLGAAGCTYESLIGQARFATAAALLQETDTKILDIALDLGYSDHAHFTRAFLRWAGCTPLEFRRRVRSRTEASGSSDDARVRGGDSPRPR